MMLRLGGSMNRLGFIVTRVIADQLEDRRETTNTTFLPVRDPLPELEGLDASH